MRAAPRLKGDVTPRNASVFDVIRGRHTVAALLILLALTAACGKDSALPVAPSDVPSRLSIEGVVRQRTDGRGVAGARVEIAEGTNQGLQAAADEQGHYRLNDLAPGSLVLRALADGYSGVTQSVTLSANQTLDFTLEPSATPAPPGAETFTLSGSVTDSRNESPIGGARIRVMSGPDRGASTQTDAAGRYSLSVQPASFTIDASAPSFVSQTRDIDLNANQVADFELHRDSSAGPGPAPEPSGPVVKGSTVNGVSNTLIAGARVRVDGGGEATSGGDGTFEVPLSSSDSVVQVTVSSESTVERSTRVRVATGPAMLTLIPKSLNLAAFDQMFRADGVLRRWTTAPAIIVERRVLQFTDVDSSSFVATSVMLSDAEIDAIVDDLHVALPELTGGTFDRFANHTVETVAEGESVSVARTGAIVLAQYQGLTDRTTFWGYTRWAWNDRGEVRAASMMLDRAFETSSSPYRHSLHTHELGHALGYSHVDARVSVMNSSGRVPSTEFDRNGARIAFLRAPLNMSPDIDPDPITVNRAPAAGLTWKGAR